MGEMNMATDQIYIMLDDCIKSEVITLLPIFLKY